MNVGYRNILQPPEGPPNAPSCLSSMAIWHIDMGWNVPILPENSVYT